mgnify:CR=1 FL=1
MILRIAIDALIVIGLFFALAGTKGVLKMPDTFCRMQASTCISTLGVLCTAIGAILYAAVIMGSAGTAVKIGVIALLIILTNPIGAHSIAKGAYKAGIRPEKEMTVDEYGRDFE